MKTLRAAAVKILGLILFGAMAMAGMPSSAQTSTSSSSTTLPPFEATARLMDALQYNGSLQDIKQLLEQGANANAKNTEGWHALNLAVKRDDIEIVKLLLDRGADVNAGNNSGYTSLDGAAYRGDTDIVKLLLERGADVNVVFQDGTSALSGAVSCDHADIVELLLDKGADINWTNKTGESILMVAIAAHATNSCRCLISRGANVNQEDDKGFSPLDMARFENDTNMVRMLEQAGATPSSASKRSADFNNGTASAANGETLLTSAKTSYLPDVTLPPENDASPRPAFNSEHIIDGDGYVTNADLLKPFTVTNSAGAVFTDAVLVKLMPRKFMYRTSSGAMGTQTLDLLPKVFLQKINYDPDSAKLADELEANRKAAERANVELLKTLATPQAQAALQKLADQTSIPNSIKARAAKNWPGNYEMQKYEIDRQTEAYHWVVNCSFISGLPSSVLEQIKTVAVDNWPGDYVMQKYETEKQANAYITLH